MNKSLAEVQSLFTQKIRGVEATPLPPNVSKAQMAVYQRLFFNTFTEIISQCFPVLISILPKELRQNLVREFLKNHPCQSPLFHHLPKDFVAFLKNKPLPQYPFVAELANFEWVELSLEISTQEIDDSDVDNHLGDLDKPLVYSSLARVLKFDYEVERISADFKPHEKKTSHLIIYRKRDDTVSFMKINELTRQLISYTREERLSANQAFRRLAETHQNLSLDNIIAGGSQTLMQLLDEDILLGYVDKPKGKST